MSFTVKQLDAGADSDEGLTFAQAKKRDGLYDYRHVTDVTWYGLAVVQDGKLVLVVDEDGISSEKELLSHWPDTRLRRLRPGDSRTFTFTQD